MIVMTDEGKRTRVKEILSVLGGLNRADRIELLEIVMKKEIDNEHRKEV